MITSSHSNHNRLLDLDHALLGWKQAAYGSRNELSQTENEQPPGFSDRWVIPDEGWEDEDENTEDGADPETDEVTSPDWFSYRRLADRLESRARGLEYSTIRQQLKDAAVEADDTLFEPSFFRDSHPSKTTGNPARKYLRSQSSPSDQLSSIPDTDAFGLPAIDLPAIDLPAIDLPDADLPIAMAAGTDAAGENSSYGSLLRTIQSARWGDASDDVEDEAFATAQTTTIDVEAQAIADLQDDWDEPLPDPFGSSPTSIPSPPDPQSPISNP